MQIALAKPITSERFLNIRNRTEQICLSLNSEDVSVQPVDFVSPPKWHLAHTTWFFEEFVLTKNKSDYKIFNKDFGYYFNSYYNNVGERVLRANRGLMTRPTFKDVLDYRAHVNKNMAQFLEGEIETEIYHVIEIGLQHEQQHQELLIYDIKYILGHQISFPTLDFDVKLHPENPNQQFIKIEEGVYEIGHNEDCFCWDNELGHHKVYLHDFEISNRLVTNAEYIDFIEAGGYRDFNLWHADGWDWITNNDITQPMYWYKVSNKWMYYTLSGYKAIEPDRPVSHISFYEAFAFAQWKDMRLPTEFEWEVASKYFDYGQLWEWANSAYLPYPNYTKAEGAIGEYNGKFMVNTMVMRGASAASPQGHCRPTYRNFFAPDNRWQFSGIRLAK
ncbi:ergothioneine biosynthesis protein EgtB [Winogradskyella tangerina]|uniref:ergothioneine biosynthesis protein EgtB n=1 Tax=Winogradskyella tangerina TaxID=2023240 RepID=UPI001E607AF7|nr:ergothioneine biosynthesis protein EgtB [Winogradskyella tangerina]